MIDNENYILDTKRSKITDNLNYDVERCNQIIQSQIKS